MIDLTTTTASPLLAAVAAPDMTHVSPAFRIGYEDGAERQPFCPEAFFAGSHRQSSYVLGFITAQPSNMIAISWWHAFLTDDAADRAAAAVNASFVSETMGAW